VVQIDYGLGAGGLIERGMAAARERTRAIDKAKAVLDKGTRLAQREALRVVEPAGGRGVPRDAIREIHADPEESGPGRDDILRDQQYFGSRRGDAQIATGGASLMTGERWHVLDLDRDIAVKAVERLDR
jgi:hypothetical protein